MALIKHAKSDRLLKEAIVLDMGDLGRQGERIVSEARARAAATDKRSTKEAQRLIDSADERGFNEGLERGMVEGREAGQLEGREQAMRECTEQITQVVDLWTSALANWEVERNSMLHEAREDVIRFALALAHKIVHRVVQTDPTVVRDQLGHAMSLVSRSTAVEICINPHDRAIASEVAPQLTSGIAGCEHVSIRDDESISRGGCIVRTAGGRVDATIETQIARITDALLPDQGKSQEPVEPPDPSHTDAPLNQ